MSNPMAVTLDSYNNSRSNFTQHYYLADCNSKFGGQDIQLSWDSFSTAVNDFTKANSLAASDIALRFVLCYDATANELYLRMQICTMAASLTPGTYNLVTTTCAWYTIRGGSITATSNTATHDQAYLDAFYYCSTGSECTAETCQNLAADTSASVYTRNVTFPWSQEILQMYLDNSSPLGGSISFAACSFPATSTVSVCAYQHTLVLYLRDSSGAMLVDNTPTSNFQMKAADLGTMCPHLCDCCVC